jgi:outer membrane biosynthesis protein TonB
MKAGYTISAATHALILGWGLVSFSAKPLEVPPTDAIETDVISEVEFNRLTNGVRTAKQVTKPAPVVDKVGEVKEPPKDPLLKVTEKQEVMTTTAPPPPPDVKPPDPKPDPKPAEPKTPQPKAPEPPPPPAAAAEPPPPDPAAEALKIEEAKQKAEQQRKLEEARQKKLEEARQKKIEDAKKREEARLKKLEEEKTRKEVDSHLDRITAQLDKRAPQRQAATGTIVNPTPSAGTTTGNASQLEQNVLGMLVAQIKRCWDVPAGMADAKYLKPVIGFALNRDGSLANAPKPLNPQNTAVFQVAAESAIRAVYRCAPYRLPAANYEVWSDNEITFDPKDMYQ